MTESTSICESSSELSVYSAAQQQRYEEGRQLVLKQVRNQETLDDKTALKAAQCLISEAAILATLPRHPNITRLVSVSENLVHDTSNGFLVFERVQGTLDHFLNEWRSEQDPSSTMDSKPPRRSRRWPCKLTMLFQQRNNRPTKKWRGHNYQVQRILKQIVSAMEFLHEQGVLHRDLKPANIGIGYDGQVKLLDFGLSRNQVSKTGRNLTQAVGTLCYMASEVALSREYGFPADVHSFAIVMWELLTLQRPFDGLAKTKEDLSKAIHENHKRPSTRLVKSPELRRLLCASWDPDPNKRLTFQEMARQLKEEHPPSRRTQFFSETITLSSFRRKRASLDRKQKSSA